MDTGAGSGVGAAHGAVGSSAARRLSRRGNARWLSWRFCRGARRRLSRWVWGLSGRLRKSQRFQSRLRGVRSRIRHTRVLLPTALLLSSLPVVLPLSRLRLLCVLRLLAGLRLLASLLSGVPGGGACARRRAL